MVRGVQGSGRQQRRAGPAPDGRGVPGTLPPVCVTMARVERPFRFVGIESSVTEVVVIGAGLAGLSCARDLQRGGEDVLVLEARDRPGGSVEQVALPDGRTLQMG